MPLLGWFPLDLQGKPSDYTPLFARTLLFLLAQWSNPAKAESGTVLFSTQEVRDVCLFERVVCIFTYMAEHNPFGLMIRGGFVLCDLEHTMLR